MVKYVIIEEIVEIPSGVTLKLEEKKVIVEGKKGKVEKDFNHMKSLDFKLADSVLTISTNFPKKKEISLAKTARNVIENLIKGVENEYIYKMKIVYSHFPITVVPPKGNERIVQIMNFIGERAPRLAQIYGDVKIKADKAEVEVRGCDKDAVGQTCANIQLKCRIRDKDKRVFQDGVYVYSKALGDELLWKIK